MTENVDILPGLQAEKSRRQRAIGVLYASAGSKKAHMTKNAGFYIVSLVGKVLLNNIHKKHVSFGSVLFY